MEKETIITILFGLLATAYGFIFYSVIGRLKKLENAGCNPSFCYRRFEKIEGKQDKTDLAWTEIQVRLAKIETILIEMQKK